MDVRKTTITIDTEALYGPVTYTIAGSSVESIRVESPESLPVQSLAEDATIRMTPELVPGIGWRLTSNIH